MRFKVLGPLEVEQDGATVDIGSQRQREILSALLLQAGTVVPTERLLDWVWEPDQPGSENALWVAISRLRSRLGGEVVITHDHGYSAEVGPGDLDADRFERLLMDARAVADEHPDTAAAMVEEALGLWRGEAFADVRYRDFALAEARRLDELHTTAGEDLAEWRIRAGRPATAIADLEAATVRDPLRERPVALLMQALADTDRRAEALAVFSRHRRHLGDELGLEPSSALGELEDRILEDLVAAEHAGDTPHRVLTTPPDEDAGRTRTQPRGWILTAVLVLAVGAAIWAALTRGTPTQVLLVDAPLSGPISEQLSSGLADAGRRHDITVDELRPIADVDEQLENALSATPDIIVVGRDLATIAPGFDWLAATETLSDTRFIDLSAIGVGPIGHPRWIHVDFADEEGAFLAGALAALRTRSGIVGYVGAHPGLVDDLRSGFEAGVAHMDEDVTVVSAHTPVVAHPLENFLASQAPRAAVTTRQVLATGADVILNAHGSAGIGVTEAVAEAEGARWVIGIDADHYAHLLASEPAAAPVVLASLSRRFDRAVSLAVDRALDGETGDLEMGLANGGFSILDGAESLTAEETAALGAATAAIEAGLTVAPWPRTPPSETTPGAVEAHAMVSGTGTTVTAPDQAIVGRPITLHGSTRRDADWPATVVTVGRLRPGVAPADLPARPDGLAPFLVDVWDAGIARSWTTVPIGGAGDITVVPDRPGSWAAACQPFDGAGRGPVTWTVFEVVPGT